MGGMKAGATVSPGRRQRRSGGGGARRLLGNAIRAISGGGGAGSKGDECQEGTGRSSSPLPLTPSSSAGIRRWNHGQTAGGEGGAYGGETGAAAGEVVEAGSREVLVEGGIEGEKGGDRGALSEVPQGGVGEGGEWSGLQAGSSANTWPLSVGSQERNRKAIEYDSAGDIMVDGGGAAGALGAVSGAKAEGRAEADFVTVEDKATQALATPPKLVYSSYGDHRFFHHLRASLGVKTSWEESLRNRSEQIRDLLPAWSGVGGSRGGVEDNVVATERQGLLLDLVGAVEGVE
ncbi:unnamed protein product [Choristocarpus tenellus]